MEKVQQMHETLGPAPYMADLWASIVDVADGWTEYNQKFGRIVSAAREVGITEPWLPPRG
ncbi:hypothetical protein BST44_16300 [Mycobacterium scrofulaceum]|uniref:Uncharacterized protein n=2 Tax=Mycobacterium scrofulaceum TaxID=1783 RepID=A0A1X0KD72_MYCSC|nr:hypothetical protein BST44_16300 [Mycobacterium scrofulaceum]